MGREFFDLPIDEQQKSLTEFAHTLLESYAINDAKVSCINFEFNATFSVETQSAQKYALRININSTRSLANLKGEVEWARFLNRVKGVRTPSPIATMTDEYVISREHADSGELLYAIMYSWIEGDEIGGDPNLSQLQCVGEAIATMHQQSQNFKLPSDSELPIYDDFFWGAQDFLFSEKTLLSDSQRVQIQLARDVIMKYVGELYAQSPVMIIHADFHGWNLIWNQEQLYVFDFDDCGFGLEAQDLAVALYYLDTPEQDAALLKGYESVKALPQYSDSAMKALLLQRRLHLLNYLCETKNPEHKAMLPAYLEKSIERVEAFLTDVRG